MLYDFNAQPGTTWTLFANYSFPPCAPGTTTVDSVGTIILNSTSLLFFYSAYTTMPGYTLSGQTIQKIGNLSYLLPQYACVIDLYEANYLRCYTDSSGWSYSTGIVPYCNYITEVKELSFLNNLSISPNPANEFLVISSQFGKGEKTEIIISNVLGKEVVRYHDNLSFSSLRDTKIDISNLANGIYFVKVATDKGSVVKKVVKE